MITHKVVEIWEEDDVMLSDFLSHKYQLDTWFNVKHSLDFMKSGIQIFIHCCAKAENRNNITNVENYSRYLKENITKCYQEKKINKKDLFLLTKNNYQFTKVLIELNLLDVNEYIPENDPYTKDYNNGKGNSAPLFFNYCYNVEQIKELHELGANFLLPYKNHIGKIFTYSINIFKFKIRRHEYDSLLMLLDYFPKNKKAEKKLMQDLEHVEHQETKKWYQQKYLKDSIVDETQYLEKSMNKKINIETKYKNKI